MFSVARLVKVGYVLGLFVALLLLRWPNLSHGQFGGGMMRMGGGMSPLQLQLLSDFGAVPVNGMGGMMGMGRGGMMGMGGMGVGMMGMGGRRGGMMGMGGGMGGRMVQGGGRMGQGGGMNGMGGGMMGMGGGMMGTGGGISPLQLQLLSDFGAVPVNGMGGMMGFAGKNLGAGFNGRNGL